MGSTGYDESSQKAIESDLLDTGNMLLSVPSSTGELLVLLQKAERLLAKVWQQPPMSTRRSLLPIMKALIVDDIMHHVDANIQVLVASCFNELSRISAPESPYPDELSLEFFRLFVIAFQQLPNVYGHNYARVLKIIETMAKVRSALMLLDIDHGLVVEMFRLFLDNVRSNHPSDSFNYMETIISTAIEESDEISFELLSLLLSSVKMNIKDTSPISWELGRKVIQNCATKVQPYLKEAVKALNLDVDEYADIVASLCWDPSDGGIMFVQTSFENSRGHHWTAKSDLDAGDPRPRKRSRKPNSVVRPEEGNCRNQSMLGNLSQRKISLNDVGLVKRGKLKKKTSITNGHNDLQKPNRKVSQTIVNKVGKKAIAGSSSIRDKEEEIATLAEAKVKHKLSTPEQYGRKEMKEGLVPYKDLQKQFNDKIDRPSVLKPADANYLWKEKKLKKSRVDYGAELINRRIQVWWPEDEQFYTGTVVSFHPIKKRHKVLYDDGDKEFLNLKHERIRFPDEQPPRIQVAGPTEHTKILQKNAKRKTGASKQLAASSYKRPKSENASLVKLGEHFAHANNPCDESSRQ